MPDRPYNLAIETSGRRGSVSLGRGDELLGSSELPPQERHRVDLVPAIDERCRRHGARPENLGAVYLSIGPGSFTGLRIAVTTAKMLAAALGTRLVAVPTLEVVAQNAIGFEFRPRMVSSFGLGEPGNSKPETRNSKPILAVCLNLKQDTVYAGLFTWQETGAAWVAHAPPALMALRDLLTAAPRPLALLGEVQDQLAALPAELRRDVTLLPAELATGRSDALWRLGRAAARRGQFADPLALLPLYVRLPEAEELWKQRHR